jgi:hypothetical protein
MKTIIGDNVFITKFSYEKAKTLNEYAVEILRMELSYAEACAENDRKKKKDRVKIEKPTYRKYRQRFTTCKIMHGKVGEKEMRGCIADISVVNHPEETFTFASGRKYAFKMALDSVLLNDSVCDMVGITNKRESRGLFMSDFFKQCPTSFHT